MINGIIIQNQLIKLEIIITQIKLIKIFNKIWPESILANSRIAKLNILEI